MTRDAIVVLPLRASARPVGVIIRYSRTGGILAFLQEN